MKHDEVKYFYRTVSILLPSLIIIVYMFVVYNINGLYPFGDKSVSWCDMTQQKIPQFNNFKDILDGKSSLFLNFQNAGGMNYYSVMISFFFNPINYCVKFVPKEKMIFFVNILVILNMALCALSANYCFGYIHKKLDVGIKIVLSIMYPLSGYSLMYYQNIGFFNAMWIFPLVVVSLYRLVKEQRPLMYMIILTISLLFGYYFSYMLAIVILLFVGIYYIRNRGRLGDNIRFRHLFICSIIPVFLSAFVWLPSLKMTMESGRVSTGFLKSVSTSSYLTPYQTALPMLFCSALLFVIILSDLVFTRQYRSEDNIIALEVLGFTLIPFIVEPINKMWHMGQYQCFPCRFGYMTIFLALFCVGYVLERDYIQNKKTTENMLITIVICIVIYLCYKGIHSLRVKNLNEISQYALSLWGNQKSFNLLLCCFLIMITSYSVVWSLYRRGYLPKGIFVLFIALLFLIESYNNISVYMIKPANNNANLVRNIVKGYALADRINDDKFYRVKSQAKLFNNNYIGSLGYNTIAHYTSYNNKNYMFSMKRLGYTGVWMETGATDGSRLTDALLSIRYKINGGISHSKEIYHSNAGSIHQLPDYLPMGLLLPLGTLIGKDEIPDGLDRTDIQKYVSETIFRENLITRYTPINKKKAGNLWRLNEGDEIKYNVEIHGEQTLYIDCFNKPTNHVSESIYNALDVYVNGRLMAKSYPNGNWNGVDRIGDYNDTTINIVIKVKKTIQCASFGIFGVNVTRLLELCSLSKGIGLTVKNDGLAGNCNLDSPKTCFVSLPYQDNFTVRINGKKVKYQRALSAFICFDLPQGESRVRISFIPNGLRLGVFLTIIGIALFVLFIKFNSFLLIWKNSVFDKISQYAVLLAAGSVFFLIYIFPVVAKILAFAK